MRARAHLLPRPAGGLSRLCRFSRLLLDEFRRLGRQSPGLLPRATRLARHENEGILGRCSSERTNLRSSPRSPLLPPSVALLPGDPSPRS